MGELFQQAEAWLDRIEQTQDYTLPYVDLESKLSQSFKLNDVFLVSMMVNYLFEIFLTKFSNISN
jgi:hypothetical protein